MNKYFIISIGCLFQISCTSQHTKLFDLSTKKNSPVIYNEALNEYQFVYNGTTMPLYFDPFTGSKLPSTKRDDYYFKKSTIGIKKFNNSVKNIHSWSNWLKLNGPPTYSSPFTDDGFIYHSYDSLPNETLTLSVKVKGNKVINYEYYPMAKPL